MLWTCRAPQVSNGVTREQIAGIDPFRAFSNGNCDAEYGVCGDNISRHHSSSSSDKTRIGMKGEQDLRCLFESSSCLVVRTFLCLQRRTLVYRPWPIFAPSFGWCFPPISKSVKMGMLRGNRQADGESTQWMR